MERPIPSSDKPSAAEAAASAEDPASTGGMDDAESAAAAQFAGAEERALAEGSRQARATVPFKGKACK